MILMLYKNIIAYLINQILVLRTLMCGLGYFIYIYIYIYIYINTLYLFKRKY